MFPLHTLNFEVAPEAVEPAGGAEVEAGEPAGPWAPDPEQWETIVRANERMLEALDAAQQQPELQAQPGYQPGAPGADEIPDPIDDPQGYRDYLLEQVQGVTQPLTAWQKQMEAQEGREVGFDILADIESREGEFLNPDYSRERAYELADRYYPEAVQRFGDKSSKAAEHALQRAYKEIREHEQAIGKAYHERQMNEMATLSGARTEPSAAGAAGAQQVTIPEGGNEMDLVRRHFGHT